MIYVDTPFKQEHKAILFAGAPQETFVFKEDLKEEKAQLDTLLSAEIVMGNPRPVEWLGKAVNLKWVQLYSTGFEYYRSIKIPAVVTNMQDYYSQPCAETAISGIMALYRGMNDFAVLKKQKEWVGYHIREGLQILMNRKIIIMGYGSIGKRIAKILSGFDCEIRIYARTAAEASIRSVHELEQTIGWADVIIGCLPGTTDTKGLFTSHMINKMQSHAIFCNVGRGNLVADEAALVNALMEHKIGGAVLDVTAEEPLPAGHPLWDCPNTILTQHSGGGNITEYHGIAHFFVENLKRFRNNEPLKNRVNFERGY